MLIADSSLVGVLWDLVDDAADVIATRLPDPPAEPATLTLPWPDFLPSWPMTLSFATVVATLAAVLAIRFARWLYGLVPVAQ